MTDRDPMFTQPGSPPARRLGCTCEQQDPQLIEQACTCGADADMVLRVHATGCAALMLRPAWNVERDCPVHGLDAIKAWMAANPPTGDVVGGHA